MQAQIHTLGGPDTKTLPGRTGKCKFEFCTAQTVPAITPCNLTGKPGTDRAIEIIDIKFLPGAFRFRKGPLEPGHNSGIELTLIMRMVANTGITTTLGTGSGSTGQDRVQVNTALFVGQRFDFIQQIAAPNDVFKFFKTQV